MWSKEKGILLSVVHHTDKLCVANIYTLGGGFCAYSFFLPKSTRTNARNTLLMPLSLIDFESDTSGAGLARMRGASFLSPYRDIPFNHHKISIALFLSEFLTASLRSEKCGNSGLFNFLLDSLLWFDSAAEFSNFHLFLSVHISCFLGIAPDLSTYANGYTLDLQNGMYVLSESDAALRRLSWLFVSLQKAGLEQMQSTEMSGTERSAMLNMLCTYYSFHIPSFPHLKSIEILHTIF